MIAVVRMPAVIEKNSKNQCQNPACEEETTSYNVNFCLNTIFSLYI